MICLQKTSQSAGSVEGLMMLKHWAVCSLVVQRLMLMFWSTIHGVSKAGPGDDSNSTQSAWALTSCPVNCHSVISTNLWCPGENRQTSLGAGRCRCFDPGFPYLRRFYRPIPRPNKTLLRQNQWVDNFYGVMQVVTPKALFNHCLFSSNFCCKAIVKCVWLLNQALGANLSI